jgi:glycosyltransferase involved in cell wall biosynthesis
MNILFHFVALPNLSNKSSIFTSLIHEFKSNGHRVFVSSKGLGISKTSLSEENSIPVLRIKSNDFTGITDNVKKAIGYIEYSFKQAYYVCKYFENIKFDLIITHSLPPELAFVINSWKKKFRCPIYLIQSDYTWQDAVAFGFFSKNNPVALYYQYWERKLFKYVDYIACPTKGNISFIKTEYPNIEDNKFRYLPFWQKPISLSNDGSIRKMYGLDNKFVVVYGGSIGAAQRIERLVDLANECKCYEDIIFVILGKGAYLPVIEKMVRERNIGNVLFKKFLPQEDYLKFLSSCDVGMIILNEKTGTPNFPSKSLSYLSMKVPILAALDYVTDFGYYLEDNNAGLWAYCDDVKALKNQLLKYYESPSLREMIRESGYMLYLNNMTPSHAYDSIMQIFY